MFSQLSGFFSGLKVSLKSSVAGSGSEGGAKRRTKNGAYRSTREARGGAYDDDDDDDDDTRSRGCLGRSVSMEWGSASAKSKRRATSSESLQPTPNRARSATSLVDASQVTHSRSRSRSGRQKGRGGGDGVDGAGFDSGIESYGGGQYGFADGGVAHGMGARVNGVGGVNGEVEQNESLFDVTGGEGEMSQTGYRNGHANGVARQSSSSSERGKAAALSCIPSKSSRHQRSAPRQRSSSVVPPPRVRADSYTTPGTLHQANRLEAHIASTASLIQLPPTPSARGGGSGGQKERQLGRRANKAVSIDNNLVGKSKLTPDSKNSKTGVGSSGKSKTKQKKSLSIGDHLSDLPQLKSRPIIMGGGTNLSTKASTNSLFVTPTQASGGQAPPPIGWAANCASSAWSLAPSVTGGMGLRGEADCGAAVVGSAMDLSHQSTGSTLDRCLMDNRQLNDNRQFPSNRQLSDSRQMAENRQLSESRQLLSESRQFADSRLTQGENKLESKAFPVGGGLMVRPRTILPLARAEFFNITEQTTGSGGSVGGGSPASQRWGGNKRGAADVESQGGRRGGGAMGAGVGGGGTTDRLQYVTDVNTGTTYLKGKLLGKGGFAKCYELKDLKSGIIYAGKIVSKSRLTKGNQKEKILREVELHRNLDHRNVVRFHSYFEDESNVYIVLENCSQKSLVHMIKSRRTLTEPEVRYYMHHLFAGVAYIHAQHIIHRDLKLGNMLLNDTMQIKLADFGLATRVEYEGEMKTTVCGTPNYIAPEVLQKRGHSYPADMWAMGCVMYALLCGRPPFETSTLKETYMRIVANKFVVPPHVSLSAKRLIHRLLTLDPQRRPSLSDISNDDFFVDGFLPMCLSPSTVDQPPKYPVAQLLQRPKSTITIVSPPPRKGSITSETAAMSPSLAQTRNSRKSASQIITRNKTPDFESAGFVREGYCQQAGSAPSIQREPTEDLNSLPHGSASRLNGLLALCLEASPQSNSSIAQVQRSRTVCVTKWVDYSNKYGFGFQLSNNSVGILFNDNTRMLLAPDSTYAPSLLLGSYTKASVVKRSVHYSDVTNKFHTFSTKTPPSDLQKKVTLLLYFAQYMETHLIPGGNLTTADRAASIFMKKWFRTDRAIVMYLTDGTLQVNFLEDHTKVILNPEGPDYLLTVVDSARQAASYPLSALRHFGCTDDVMSRLRYSSRMLERIIGAEGGQGGV